MPPAPVTPSPAPLPLPVTRVPTPAATPTLPSEPSHVVPHLDGTALLTTLVQSGAALVAIIAGLLVARLVWLIGERNAAERRIRELEALVLDKEAEFRRAFSARLDEDGEAFANSIQRSLIEDDQRSFEEMYRPGATNRSSDELRPYYDRLVERINSAKDKIGYNELVARKPADWNNDTEETLIAQFDDEDTDLARDILRSAKRRWPLSSIFGLDHIVMKPSMEIAAARLQVNATYYARLEDAEQHAKSELDSAKRELGLVEEALSNMAKPEGLRASMVALGGVAVAGIVLPLLQLTFGPAELSMLLRGTYTGLFVLSLAAFFGYLAWEIRRLVR